MQKHGREKIASHCPMLTDTVLLIWCAVCIFLFFVCKCRGQWKYNKQRKKESQEAALLVCAAILEMSSCQVCSYHSLISSFQIQELLWRTE